MILALDLGSRTGWAAKSKGAVTSGVADFRPRPREGSGMRYLRFSSWLDAVADQNTVEAVFYEEVRRHVGTDAAHVYGGLHATLSSWCERHRIPYAGIGVGVWKKAVVGKGNADKAEVLSAIRAAGFAVTDDNEADALALLHYVMADNGGKKK